MADGFKVIMFSADSEAFLRVGRPFGLRGGFIPALVNIKVGSFFTTMGAEGTTRCPLDSKKSRNCCLISLAVFIVYLSLFGTEIAKL